MIAEMGRIVKPKLYRYIQQLPAFRQQVLAFFDPLQDKIIIGRQPGLGFEQTQKFEFIHPKTVGGILQREFKKVFFR